MIKKLNVMNDELDMQMV